VMALHRYAASVDGRGGGRGEVRSSKRFGSRRWNAVSNLLQDTFAV